MHHRTQPCHAQGGLPPGNARSNADLRGGKRQRRRQAASRRHRHPWAPLFPFPPRAHALPGGFPKVGFTDSGVAVARAEPKDFRLSKKANPRCVSSGGLGVKPLAMTYSRMA